MIKVFIEAEAGAYEKGRYNEKTLEYMGTQRINLKYPYAYGFIIETTTENGDCVDCYIITNEYIKAGQIGECEPMGLLEQREDNEIGKILPKQEALEYIRKYRNE